MQNSLSCAGHPHLRGLTECEIFSPALGIPPPPAESFVQLQFAFGNDHFRRKISSEHFQNAKKIRLRRLLTIFLTKNGYNIDNLLQINGAEGAEFF